MNWQSRLRQALGVTLVMLLLVGCGAPAATPVVEAPAASATPVPEEATAPPTATSVPEAPTPLPPTESPTLAPEPATLTVEPPTPTTEPPSATPEPPTPTSVSPTATPIPELAISTTAFEAEAEIPGAYSCFGDNVSPALAWSGAPAEAQSLLLLMYDLDAGAESGASTPLGFAHWIVYDIPPSTTGFAEDMPSGDTLPGGALQGTNDFAPFLSAGDSFPGGAPVKLVGYDGPCPGGKHRYTFTLYALDTLLDLPAAATVAQVLEAMEGHVLAQAAVVGSYTPPQ